MGEGISTIYQILMMERNETYGQYIKSWLMNIDSRWRLHHRWPSWSYLQLEKLRQHQNTQRLLLQFHMTSNINIRANLPCWYVYKCLTQANSWVVPYHAPILLLWNAHINVQYIMNKGFARYMTKYITKTCIQHLREWSLERAHHRKLNGCEEIKGDNC